MRTEEWRDRLIPYDYTGWLEYEHCVGPYSSSTTCKETQMQVLILAEVPM